MNGSFKSNSSFSSSKMFLVESKFVANEEFGASDYSIFDRCKSFMGFFTLLRAVLGI